MNSIHPQCNKSIKFQAEYLNVCIEENQIVEQSERIVNSVCVKDKWNRLNWSIKAITLMDLTTLAGDDTKEHVARLCHRAAYPLPLKVLNTLVDPNIQSCIHTAAVCVYPASVRAAVKSLARLGYEQRIGVASVAGSFPAGQCSLRLRLMEIEEAVNDGATEIDVVINRNLAINREWAAVYEELVKMRQQCGPNVLMKTILAIGDLKTMENVYKASMVCMMAGADFIKTSTGKEAINATIPMGLVMIRAIQEFRRLTGIAVGLKPAGGIRCVEEAIDWMKLVREELGTEWLQPRLFRIGASSLLDDCEKYARELQLCPPS